MNVPRLDPSFDHGQAVNDSNHAACSRFALGLAGYLR